MEAELFAPEPQRLAAVVNLAEYRASRRQAERAAARPAWPPFLRIGPNPRQIAHRRRMLQHLLGRR